VKIYEMARLAHQNARAKGFWDDIEYPRNMSPSEHLAKHALIMSEVAECTEAVRLPGFDPIETKYTQSGKPEGLPSELADIVIRVFDYAEALGIDIETAIVEKHSYNVTRPRKHGKTA